MLAIVPKEILFKVTSTFRSAVCFWQRGLIIILLSLLASCQALNQVFETPGVELVNVSSAGQRGLQQMFNVELGITNPNAYALNLVGIDYEVRLEGFDVIKGALSSVPSIPAYGKNNINVELGVGLIQGLQLLNALSSKNTPSIDYSVRLNLNTGLPIVGIVPVQREGTFDASALTR